MLHFWGISLSQSVHPSDPSSTAYAGSTAPAGDPKFCFPGPHVPSLTGGSRGGFQASAEIQSLHLVLGQKDQNPTDPILSATNGLCTFLHQCNENRRIRKRETLHITDSKQGSILFWTSLLINAFQVLQKLHLCTIQFEIFFFLVKMFKVNKKNLILYKTQWTLKSDSSITF